MHPRFRPVRQLVTTGPFSLTRNPMYVGAAALLASLALAANSTALLLAMLAPCLAYLQLLVIPRWVGGWSGIAGCCSCGALLA